ncbi:cellulose-binding protein [Limnoraphis robusta Tam1]|uniref:cellulose-binding protein n=1 Tax=Limnoraphis robusta TaxID=1118279 RepID=UPI002B208C5E|nr:cellulose-binding protein [Limnoraphis robusta]MEA5500595.1 cellulose-binding protein [Limnoraphis robusta BA-68 BA1]MEA5541403.1 cellulose-binding protein [Limnoraphis robusta Tam1]
MKTSPFKLKNSLIFFSVGIVLFSTLLPKLYAQANAWLFPPVPQMTLSQNSNSNPSNDRSSLGINLSGIAAWSSQLPFLDYFKSSQAWITQCTKTDPGCQGEWDTKEEDILDLDENGWVKSLPAPEDSPKYTRVSSLLLRGIPKHFASGQYIVFYEGEGTIEYSLSAKKDQQASAPGRDIINVDSSQSGGVLITITATDPNKTGKYIRNIRVIYAEDESLYRSGELFNSAFLEKINKFRSLRFMDWMGTNHSQQQDWQDRPTPEIASYNMKGVALETMVSLSNKIKADPWFNMPHRATDEYMRNFAQSVKQSLDPNLNVYVEFSNEVWNWQFKQTHYALEEGQKRWGKDKKDAFRQWYGMRTAQMCDIWKDVFADQKDRVTCVIATQVGWKGSEKGILECPYWVAEGNKACYQHGIGAYAIAGYFGASLGHPDNVNKVESWLKDNDGGFQKAIQQLKTGNLLEAGREDSLPQVKELFSYHAQVAQEKGLKLMAYEGGQHIVGRKDAVNNEQLTNFFIELNRHPQMYELYTQLFKDWKEVGGTMFMHFVDVAKPTKWGSWGALEYVDQSESPKYNALMDFMAQNSCWWEGC